MENTCEENSNPPAAGKAAKGLCLNIGRISLANVITFGLQLAAIILALAFAVFNVMLSQASDVKLLSFFGENIPQGAFSSPAAGFTTFAVIFAILAVISLIILAVLFFTRGSNKKMLYYANMALLVVICAVGIYCLFGFHLVPADLSGTWEGIIAATNALGLNLFEGVKYPWPEEFIAIFSGLAFVLLLRKKARDYILVGDKD
ncbi:hypothetical protein [Candidatus Methanomassiliicoccus intestinalis]|uniref:hypothetical protein n=1 Tax=Candidatus Methanomassiliicoccus intestinalis TaxID=1406512 RepID=UPI0037DD854D